MTNIKVGRYSNPEHVGGWAGWIEDEERTWIAFIDTKGRPTFFLNRDATGAVVTEVGGSTPPSVPYGAE